jgi:hypothetical protein
MTDDTNTGGDRIELEASGILKLGGIGERREHDVDVSLVVRPRRSDFYDDGRRTVSVDATVHAGGTSVEVMGQQPDGRIHIQSADQFPDELGVDGEIPTYQDAIVTLDEEGRAAVRSAFDSVKDGLGDSHVDLIDDLDVECEITGGGESGSGETRERHKTGTLRVADGRELSVKWRNAVDIGHQVFVRGGAGQFDDDEIDALVTFARENSPLSRAMRM